MYILSLHLGHDGAYSITKDNELIELRVKLEAANTRINDLEKDKEEWREQARVLALAPPSQSKKSWLGRLFGS